jgi:ABC-type nitrate/sulfonate/bicarbonate transport system permease component
VTAPAQVRHAVGRARGRTLQTLAPLTLAAALLLIWESAVRALDIPNSILASPSAIVDRLTSQPDLFLDNLGPTLVEAFFGLILGFAIGVAGAIAIVESRLFERTFYPLFVTSQVIPTFALAPLLVLWLGFGLEPKIVIIVLWVFFPITVNMVKGLKSADPGVLALMRSYRASRTQLLRYVQLPASLPYLFAATQLAVTYAVLGAVFVEWFGALKGLGKLMLVGARRQTDLMLASVVLVSIIALILFLGVRLLARMAMPWQRAIET